MPSLNTLALIVSEILAFIQKTDMTRSIRLVILIKVRLGKVMLERLPDYSLTHLDFCGSIVIPHYFVFFSFIFHFFWRFSQPACVPTSQWPVRARTSIPHSVRQNLSSSEVFFTVNHRLCLVRDTTLWCVLPMSVGLFVPVTRNPYKADS